MSNKKFKTNIKCSACVAKVAPALDETFGAGNWAVDLQHPDRLLAVPDTADLTIVAEALAKTGYQAVEELVNR
ncbi:MAG: hypothetical protein IT259_12915 [Saprospiraceae bacterium]|nr:hypothetical protein [Saprospiraceae bacterium]